MNSNFLSTFITIVILLPYFNLVKNFLTVDLAFGLGISKIEMMGKKVAVKFFKKSL